MKNINWEQRVFWNNNPRKFPLPAKKPCRVCGNAKRSPNGLLKCLCPYPDLYKEKKP